MVQNYVLVVDSGIILSSLLKAYVRSWVLSVTCVSLFFCFLILNEHNSSKFHLFWYSSNLAINFYYVSVFILDRKISLLLYNLSALLCPVPVKEGKSRLLPASFHCSRGTLWIFIPASLLNNVCPNLWMWTGLWFVKWSQLCHSLRTGHPKDVYTKYLWVSWLSRLSHWLAVKVLETSPSRARSSFSKSMFVLLKLT